MSLDRSTNNRPDGEHNSRHLLNVRNLTRDHFFILNERYLEQSRPVSFVSFSNVSLFNIQAIVIMFGHSIITLVKL